MLQAIPTAIGEKNVQSVYLHRTQFHSVITDQHTIVLCMQNSGLEGMGQTCIPAPKEISLRELNGVKTGYGQC